MHPLTAPAADALLNSACLLPPEPGSGQVGTAAGVCWESTAGGRDHDHLSTCYWDFRLCRWVCPDSRQAATAAGSASSGTASEAGAS